MLPKIDVPIYELIVPSTGQSVKVRPFNVKEEKLLFMAVEAGDGEEIVKTVKQVINNCILNNDINIDKLPFFDIDYIFIFLRAKSIGESVEVNMTCNNELEDGRRCGNVFEADMDIAKVDIIKDDTINDDIKLDRTKGVKMKYPTYSLMKHLESVAPIDKKTVIITNSIDKIYDEKGMYSAKDYTKEQLTEFVENLTEEKYKMLESYVDNFPTFAVRLEADCPKCGFHHNVRYTDFTDFFLS